MNTRLMVVAAAAGAALAAGLAGPAQAVPRTTVVYSSSTYLPSALAVSHGKAAFHWCGSVFEVKTDGGSEPLPYPGGCSAHVEGTGGVAYSRDGHSLATTLTVTVPTVYRQTTSSVGVSSDDGDQGAYGARVSDFEYDHNPDGAATYGTTSSSSCVRDALGASASYRGRVDSQLPAVAAGADGWYVADRDGNTIYHLDDAGKLSVLAVLAPVRVKVSTSLASTLGWPSCVVGTTVAFEAAPGELEVGPDGSVYVTGLPTLKSGQHADRSVIDKISPTSGKVKRLSQRYAGGVNLAVGTHGRLFVARDGDKISVIKKGRSSTYLKLPHVSSVETDEHGQLYAMRGSDVVRIG